MTDRLELVVDVTQEDIQNGVHGNGHWCPIALSIRRAAQLDDYDDILVEHDTIDVTKDAKLYRAKTGPVMGEFVELFDNRTKVEPFSLGITLEKVLRREPGRLRMWRRRAQRLRI